MSPYLSDDPRWLDYAASKPDGGGGHVLKDWVRRAKADRAARTTEAWDAIQWGRYAEWRERTQGKLL